MNTFFHKLSRNNLVLFLVLFALATAFYLFKIGFSDMWSDEAYTQSMITGTLSDMFGKFRNDLHPPLYYLGLRLFTTLFGTSLVSMRLFSVLGVLALLLLGYFTGQRIFGKQGAIYFCLMVVALPMMASYSHEARMYTWASFTITGVFLYSLLFMQSGSQRDLLFLFIFTLAALYIHYYSTVAALVANALVFLYLVGTHNKNWVRHLISVIIALLLFLPWIPMFMVQVKKVQHAFWAPDVNLNALLSCFTIPFTEQYWTTAYSILLIILIYSLTAFALYRSFTPSFARYRQALWLALGTFLGTLLVVTVISLFSQPILFSRYVMTLVTLLIVPVTLLLISIKVKWLKIVLTILILFLGIRVSFSTFNFSYGPYAQTVMHIANNYPEIRKVLHLSEITAGPMVEYTGDTGLEHYWLKAEMSNVDAFPEINQYRQPGEFLQQGETFCVVQYDQLDLNMENLDRVLAESDRVRTDTVVDNKVENGSYILVYLLTYQGR